MYIRYKHIKATDLQMMPYSLPSTQSSHTFRIRTAIPERSLLTTAQQHNTISPMKLIGKCTSLGLRTTLCNLILDFFSNRPQILFTETKFQSQILVKFYRGAVESVLTGNISNWQSLSTAQDSKSLQQVIKMPRTSLVPFYRASVTSVK